VSALDLSMIASLLGCLLPDTPCRYESTNAATSQSLVRMIAEVNFKRPRGRPCKMLSKAGRPAQVAILAPGVLVNPAPSATPIEAKPSERGLKARRVNYSKGDGLAKMTSATNAWKEEQRKPIRERKSMKKFAKEWGIPFSTLKGRCMANIPDNYLNDKGPHDQLRYETPDDECPTSLKVPALDVLANNAQSAVATEPKPKGTKTKARRMNYSRGEGLAKMDTAVTAWESEQQKPAGERTSLKKFSREWDIPYSTLQGHLTSNDSKRIKLGSSVGKSPIIGREEERNCQLSYP